MSSMVEIMYSQLSNDELSQLICSRQPRNPQNHEALLELIKRNRAAKEAAKNILESSYEPIPISEFSFAEDEAEELSTNFEKQANQPEADILKETKVNLQRAVALETISTIATSTSVLSVDELLQSVVDLTKQNFDLYHVQIYLYDKDDSELVLAAGTGDIGHMMVKSGHRFSMDNQSSLVTRAATLLETVVTNDTDDVTDFLSMLPETRSQLAVPMLIDNEIIGVLDLQSEIPGRFDDDEIRIQRTLASLVSLAISNAQALEHKRSVDDRLSEVDRLKSQFLARMSHELRTPLNLIINNMDFMRIGAFGDVTDEQVSHLNQTVHSAEQLLYLINDLMDASTIEAGKMVLFIQKQEIYTMLEDIIDNAYSLLDIYNKEGKVVLQVKIDDDLPEIPVDRRRVRQVLNNLLSNGIKFTKEGVVTLKVFTTKDGVHFSVHDTGMGISPDDLQKLLPAFERTNAAKQHEVGGTGFGLMISRYLVQQHGSDLTVTSEIRHGSTFAFTLPFETDEVDTQEAEKDNTRTFAGTSEDSEIETSS